MVVCIKKQNKKNENLIETIYDNWARRKGQNDVSLFLATKLLVSCFMIALKVIIR